MEVRTDNLIRHTLQITHRNTSAGPPECAINHAQHFIASSANAAE
jgi:hypothetical protein